MKAERSFPDFALLNPGYSFFLGNGVAKLGRVGAARIFHSSLPGLTRQSMGQCRSLSFAAWLEELRFSMDHRVKPAW